MAETIFLDTSGQSRLASYAGLLDTIANWLDRDDLKLQIPEFVRLAEARFRRVIVSPEREEVITLDASGSATLPADFDSARSIYLTVPRSILTAMEPASFFERGDEAQYLDPVYTIIGGQIMISPVPVAPTQIVMAFLGNLPTLGYAMQSNWLLAKHPDLYLFGALLEAEAFGWNDERVPLFKSAVDEALGEVNMAGVRKRYGGGPLVARSSVREWLGC